MSSLRLQVAFCLVLTFLAAVARAADPPRPPQPSFTGDTLREWREELVAFNGLTDNVFLYEEAASDFNRRLAAWQGADVVFSLPVVRVTKEVVVCQTLYVGQITARNQQQPGVTNQMLGLGELALRIGDVVPLEVARRLRGKDTIVLRGVVEASSYLSGRGLKLAIDQGQVSAVVSRSYIGSALKSQVDEYLPTPDYPLEALATRTDGVAVVSVAKEKVTLASSSGNPALDQAVLNSLKRIEHNSHLFPGEHRYAFTILKP